MRKILRILLFMIAIATGSLLGNLLTGFELYKMCLFGAACFTFGYLFHAIDKIISFNQ